MGQVYTHLNSEERNFIQRHLNLGRSRRWIAAHLGRSAATISREVKRSAGATSDYDAAHATLRCRARRRRGLVKLREGTALRTFVLGKIRLAWSPQQISGKLKAMNNPDLPPVSHETIYRATYVIPLGELRKHLIGFLRQAKKIRGARVLEQEHVVYARALKLIASGQYRMEGNCVRPHADGTVPPALVMPG